MHYEPTITATGARPHQHEAASRDVALLRDHVDIVEAGTILCLTEGLSAVKALRAQCPDKLIVADWKVADAGKRWPSGPLPPALTG